MRAKSILVGTFSVLLMGCIPSYNPYYLERDIVFDASLIGRWAEGQGTWNFARHPEAPGYRLTITSAENQDGIFKATLFELGGHRFLDLVPEDYDYPDGMSELVFAALFPGHLVLHVAAIEPGLEVALFNPDRVAELIEENPRSLSHRVEADRILLTGKTRELQRFLRRHVAEPGFFEDYSDMSRLPGT